MASNKCVTPDVVILPKISTAHATSATSAASNVGAMMGLLASENSRLIPISGSPILVPAGAVSHIIEPTGPVMGPDAVADVVPPGGMQEPR